jgi:hypothetical protein
MQRGGQKTKKWEAVRIWPDPHDRFTKLILNKKLKSEKRVTEVSEASKAIAEYCEREERKMAKV